MKRNICKMCGSKKKCQRFEIYKLNIQFWLCDFCSTRRIKRIMPLKIQAIIK